MIHYYSSWYRLKKNKTKQTKQNKTKKQKKKQKKQKKTKKQTTTTTTTEKKQQHFPWILRYRDRLLRAVCARKDKETLNYGKISPHTTEEMQNAEIEILKHIQRQHFA